MKNLVRNFSTISCLAVLLLYSCIPLFPTSLDPLAPKSGVDATVAWLDQKHGPPDKTLIFEDGAMSLWVYEWDVGDTEYRVYKVNGQYQYVITIP